jgi:hypothetical protein
VGSLPLLEAIRIPAVGTKPATVAGRFYHRTILCRAKIFLMQIEVVPINLVKARAMLLRLVIFFLLRACRLSYQRCLFDMMRFYFPRPFFAEGYYFYFDSLRSNIVKKCAILISSCRSEEALFMLPP